MDEFGKTVAVQLFHQIVAMMLDGLNADTQRRGNLAIGLNGSDKTQDLPFSGCKTGAGIFQA